jgi:serine/threonine protein kinase
MSVQLLSTPDTFRGTLFDGRYHLLSELGRGTSSRVILAEDRFNGNRQVALKQLCLYGLHPAHQQVARQCFDREVALLPQLFHPRIPGYLGHSISGWSWYLAMEYIEGETLERCLHRLKRQGGRLPLEEALTVGIQLCEVLGYLHSRQPPIIFGDLKPANVMVTGDEPLQVVLLDFGTAWCYTPGRPRAIALGTSGYAPPEQYPDREGCSWISPASDIYSLGAVLHQAFSGFDPAFATRRFHSASLKAEVPSRELDKLIRSMLARRPGSRPTSLAEVAGALRQIQSLVRAERHWP